MKKTMWTAMALVAVLAVPAMGQAAQAKSGSAKAAPAASTKPAAATTTKSTKSESHSASGVVKSMDDTSLVVAHKGKKESDLTFVVDNSTKKEGNVVVGSSVTVKYHTEGGKNIATEIDAKGAAPAKTPPK